MDWTEGLSTRNYVGWLVSILVLSVLLALLLDLGGVSLATKREEDNAVLDDVNVIIQQHLLLNPPPTTP